MTHTEKQRLGCGSHAGDLEVASEHPVHGEQSLPAVISWGKAGLGHEADVLSLSLSVWRWFSSALLSSEQQTGREQGLAHCCEAPGDL